MFDIKAEYLIPVLHIFKNKTGYIPHVEIAFSLEILHFFSFGHQKCYMQIKVCELCYIPFTHSFGNICSDLSF